METSESTVSSRSAAAIDLPSAAAGLAELWSPRVAAQVNDVLVKVVRIAGDFVWHDHPDTDEAFLCLDGRVELEVRDAETGREHTVELRSGNLYVVQRGVWHCPHAADGATVALFEAAGVVNTGGTGGELTAPVDRPLESPLDPVR